MKLTTVDHDPFAFRPATELPASVADQGYGIAHVKIGDVDREWQNDEGYYIHPNDERDGKLTKAKHYILSDAKKFEVPLLGVHPAGSERGNVGFDDGRHRFAAARDLGYDSMPVGMDPESLKNARERGFLVE